MFKMIYIAFFGIFMVFTATAQIEVMSYNIRFANENDGENSWSKRKDFITDQIKFHEPDILGVQEALNVQLDYFKENIQKYNYLGVGRDDGKTKGEFSAIFYDSYQFDVMEEGTFWLSKTPEVPSKSWDAALPRICTYAMFKDKKSDNFFWVFNTHFDHVGEKAREESAKLILAKIDSLTSGIEPVILMGDLNLTPETESIKYLSEKMNDARHSAKYVSFGPEGTFSGYDFTKPVTNRIDYIFTNSKTDILKYAILSDSKDLKYPSDHLPVWVKIDFD